MTALDVVYKDTCHSSVPLLACHNILNETLRKKQNAPYSSPVEGGEGSGKSSLVRELRTEFAETSLSREKPGGSPYGETDTKCRYKGSTGQMGAARDDPLSHVRGAL